MNLRKGVYKRMAKNVTLTDKEGNVCYPRTTIDNVIGLTEGGGDTMIPPFKFGIDENGNYGYIKDGADTVIPFKSGDTIGMKKMSIPINDFIGILNKSKMCTFALVEEEGQNENN